MPSAVDRAPRPWALSRMARPPQLLLIAAVYALGVAIAVGFGSPLDWRAAVAGLLALVPTAASVHYVNEYADHETDARTERTAFSGGSAALQRTGLPRVLALRAAMVAGAVGAIVTVGVALAGALPVRAAFVLAAIALLGWGYSVGPALAWHGLGEVDNAVLGGLLLPHYGAAALGRFDLAVCLAVVPFALLVFANLLSTQWPDREADAAVGKRTLVTRLAPATLRGLHAASVFLAFASLAALAGNVLPHLVAGAGVAALPFALWGVATYTRDRNPLPSVAAMVVMAVAQLLAWVWLIAR